MLPRQWFAGHSLAWAGIFAVALASRTPIDLLIARIVNAVVCPLASAGQSSPWGGCLYGIDPGLAVGPILSMIVAVALIGLGGGLAQAWALNHWLGASWWFAPLTVSLASAVAFFVLWVQPFLGILNVIIGGVNLDAASAVMGVFVGAIFGLGVAIVTTAVLPRVEIEAA